MNKYNYKLLSNITVSIYSLILVLLNFVRIFDNNYWEDEAWTVIQSRMTYLDMIRYTGADVHPPLFYAFVKVLKSIFGAEGWVYHLSGFLPYLVIMVVSFWVIRKEWGDLCYILFATCASLLNSCVRFNVEIRMYSLGAMLTFVAYLGLRNIILRNKIRDYCVFLIASVFAAYTHYYCLIGMTIMHCMLFIYFLIKKRNQIIRSFLVSLCFGLCYIPWLFVLLETFKRTSGDYWMAEIPSIKSCLLYMFDSEYIYSLILFLCMGIAFAIYYIKQFSIISVERHNNGRKIKISFRNIILTEEFAWELIGLLTFLGTLCVGIGVSYIVRPLFITRYLFPASCLCWLLCAIAISKTGQMKYILFSTFMITLLISGISNYKMVYAVDKDQANRSEYTLGYMYNNLNGEDVLLTDERGFEYNVFNCYFPENSHSFLRVNTAGDLDTSKSYWLFLTYEVTDDQLIKDLTEAGFSMEKVINHGNLGTCDTDVYKLHYKDGDK